MKKRMNIQPKKIPAWLLRMLIVKPYKKVRHNTKTFLRRRPHRSFRLTRKRDYRRSFNIPSFASFTFEVFGTLKKRKWVFLGLIFVYTLVVIIFGGMTSQQTYLDGRELVSNIGEEIYSGELGKIGEAGFALFATVTGASTTSLSDVQQVYLGLSLLMIWLTTVWLLREIMAGRKPRLRDGLYNANAPFLSTFFVGLVFLIQLLPLALLAIVYSALSGIGLLTEGFAWMLFSVIAVLVIALTLYWLTATFVALVVVTLPGMYPGRALRAAGDLVVSRRFRIMYRLIWLALTVLSLWIIVMIPLLLLEGWLRGMWNWMEYVPLIPFMATFMSSLTVVWTASYIYLLYRKLVDDDAKPA